MYSVESPTDQYNTDSEVVPPGTALTGV